MARIKPKKKAEPVEPPNNIREARERAGMSMADLAEAAGTTAPTINKLEKSQRHVTLGWLHKFAKAMRTRPSSLISDAEVAHDLPTIAVRVRGTVQAGLWQEALEWPADEQYDIWVPVNSKYAAVPKFALKVVGPSMDMKYPDGTLIVCVRLLDLPAHVPEEGKKYVIYRRDADGYECTVKELRRDPDGVSWLWPRSHHPDFQSPIRVKDLTAHMEDGDEDIVIWALVIGSYNPDD